MITAERIDPGKLNLVLSNMLRQSIVRASWQARRLHGGDVGDVRLVTGTAETEDHRHIPYQVVLKTQKKWERYADPDSWRREYDLYTSGLGEVFQGSPRWPECFHAEEDGESTQLWMEYVQGASGNNLTTGMLEQAAYELGLLQGRLFRQTPSCLLGNANLNSTDFLRNDFNQWTEDTAERRYLASVDCPIPAQLRQMFLDLHRNVEAVWEALNTLPVVLCHRDFWLENIIHSEGDSVFLDWDTAGWGFLGEDIASLIADDTAIENLGEYYRRFIPAYYRGIGEFMDVTAVGEHYIHEMILMKFGYRFVQACLYAETEGEKERQIRALQAIHDMKGGRIDPPPS